MKRSIYLAARYSRRDELAYYAGQLEEAGYEVTCRWIFGGHDLTDRGFETEQRSGFAREDWEDLCSAQTVVSFTEPEGGSAGRGGRHVEFGAALAMGKRVIVVGHRENVFHCLPHVEFFEWWPTCLEMLCQEASHG